MPRINFYHNNDKWNELRTFYTTVAVMLFGLNSLTYFSGPKPISKEALIIEDMVVSDLPEYSVQQRIGSNDTYTAEFYFVEYSWPFLIKGRDHQYLKKGLIDRMVQIGDKLKVGYLIERKEYNIYYLSKNDFELTGFSKAQLRKKVNRKLNLIPIFGMLVFIIPLFFKNEPKIRIKGKTYSIYFGTIAFVAMLICFLILIGIYGDELVSGAQFIEY